MLYESTLVADRTPFDLWMESGALSASFNADALAGLGLFTGRGKCVNCHGGPEFTHASVRNAQRGRNVIEPMQMARGTALYDNGFYNISVVPTTDDIGRGGKDLNGQPLAFSRQALFQRVLGRPIGFPITGNDGIPAVEEDGSAPVCKDANASGVCDPGEPLNAGFRRAAVDGAFKTPQLRNQALFAPYMHNGGFATLRQVVEFYNRGGNFCRLHRGPRSRHPAARALARGAGSARELPPLAHRSARAAREGSLRSSGALHSRSRSRRERLDAAAAGRGCGCDARRGAAHLPRSRSARRSSLPSASARRTTLPDSPPAPTRRSCAWRTRKCWANLIR
jgi:hypothetical protein